MNDFEKHITKAGKEYSLSVAEKARMERVVKGYMRFKPLRAPAARASSFGWFMYLHRPIAAALILVLASSSTVAYAAESSLPGDALYALKVNVSEPVRVAFATSAEAQAEVQISLAERRIEEAATLSAEGRLDTDTQESLAVAFESHAEEAAKAIEKVETEDTGTSLELSSRFESRLAAHEAVLAEVSEPSLDIAESRLSNAIRERGVVVASIRTRTEQHVAVHVYGSEAAVAQEPAPAATTMALKVAPADASASLMFAADAAPVPSYDENAAKRMRTSAEKQLKALKKTARSYLARLDASAKADAEAQLEEAESLFENGKDLLDDDSTAAFLAFQSSLSISEKLNVVLKASPTLAKARSRTADKKETTPSWKRAETTEIRSAASVTATPVEVEIREDVVRITNSTNTHVEVEIEHGETERTHEDEDENSTSGKSIFKLDFGL